MAIRYQPLSRMDSEIRLLEILPKSHDRRFERIPVCHISHTSLISRAQHVALSYVWGSNAAQCVILVDDQHVRVNQNLYDAMMALRPLEASLIIWIDFLCINQEDNIEKSWQVEMMGDIFKQATHVYAWLGAADHNSDVALRYLDKVGEKAEACWIENAEGAHLEVWLRLAASKNLNYDSGPPVVFSETPQGLAMVARRDLEDLFHSISGWRRRNNLFPLEEMVKFFARPWWGRIWVLQEVALSDNVIFACGKLEISRRRMIAAMSAYVALWTVLTKTFRRDKWSMTPYQHQLIMSLFHHRPSIMLRSSTIHRYGQFPLSALLRLTCVGTINQRRHGPHNLDSTDPRDKIFALLGLAFDREDLRKRGIVPDYTKECAEIYTSTMAALLEKGYLSLLSFCQSQRQLPNLPSWVPDWSQSATDMLQDVKNDHVTIYPAFKAGGVKSSPSDINVTRTNGLVKAIGNTARAALRFDKKPMFIERSKPSHRQRYTSSHKASKEKEKFRTTNLEDLQLICSREGSSRSVSVVSVRISMRRWRTEHSNLPSQDENLIDQRVGGGGT